MKSKLFYILFLSLFSCIIKTEDESTCGYLITPLGETKVVGNGYYKIVIENSFNDNEKASIEKSIDEWNIVLQGKFGYQLYYSADTLTEDEEKDTLKILKRDTSVYGKNVQGYTSWNMYSNNLTYSATIRLNSLKDERYKYYHGVALHEIGHALNLEHTKQEDVSIMTPIISQNEIQCIDRINICNIWKCEPLCNLN